MAKNFFGITDTGKKRTNNEDAFIAAKLQGQLITACVIDGLGGYEGGEVAAALAKESLTRTLSKPAQNIPGQLAEAFLTANQSIQDEKRYRNGAHHMACVVTLAMVDMAGNKFYYAHVGDTRLYLLRDSSLVKITNDQSFVGFLEDNGRITEEEAMTHPKRNEINKALGFDAFISATEYFDTGESPFLPGDMMLICSDGLSDMVSSAQITAILTGPGSLEQKASALVAAANEAGGNDNITVVLVQHEKKPARPVAGRATTQKKTPETTDEPSEENTGHDRVVTISQPAGNRLTTVLAIALLVALAAIGWLLLNGRQQEKQAVTPTPLLVNKLNAAEKALADSFQSSAINEIFIERRVGDAAIPISDTIFIDRDSLIFHGNGLQFKADSGYNGPAFVLGEKCRYVLLDSIVFDGFSTAIISKQNNLQLKKVKFANCRVPVMYAEKMPDSSTLNGRLINHQFTQDSTINNHR